MEEERVIEHVHRYRYSVHISCPTKNVPNKVKTKPAPLSHNVKLHLSSQGILKVYFIQLFISHIWHEPVKKMPAANWKCVLQASATRCQECTVFDWPNKLLYRSPGEFFITIKQCFDDWFPVLLVSCALLERVRGRKCTTLS